MAGLGNTLSRLKWARVALETLVRWLKATGAAPMQPARRAFALSASSALALGAAACSTLGTGSPPPRRAARAAPTAPPDMPALLGAGPEPPEPGTPSYEDSGAWPIHALPQRLPAFPWPPPEPSSQVVVRRDRFASDSTFGDVAGRLDRALRQCGHLSESYYEAPGGIAVVTRIERLREDARPVTQDRFVTPGPGTEGTYDFLGFIQSLWFAPTGYYRQIVFIITNKPFVASEAPPTVEIANRLLAGGLGYLPPNYADREFSAGHRVEALVYEFQKVNEARAEVARPSRWNAHTHLLRLGLLHAL